MLEVSLDYNLDHHKLDFELYVGKNQEVYCLLTKSTFKYIDKLDTLMALVKMLIVGDALH